jgi:predicted porin
MGDMRNLTRVGNARFDERNANTIHFQTKNFDGLAFNLAYSIHDEATQDKLADEKDEALSLSVTYKKDALDLAVAYETYAEDHTRGERNGIRLGAAYGLTSDLKLVGFFQTVDYEGNDSLTSNVFGAGAEYKLNKTTAVKGMYLARTTDDTDFDSNMIAVGVERRLDKAIRVYANYAVVANDDSVALTPWTQARTTAVAGAAGENTSGLSLGLRVDF